MKKLLCSLLMLVPLAGFGKAMDQIVNDIDGKIHYVGPQETLTYAVSSVIRKIRPFDCLIMPSTDKDVLAPYSVTTNNFKRGPQSDGNTMGQVNTTPRRLHYYGEVYGQAYSQAYFHFLNSDYTKVIAVLCRNV